MKHRHLIRWTPVWSLAAVLLLAAGAMHCGNVPLTAPSGAELNISANPTDIPAFNGVSTVTVVGFESFENGDGGPLPNGTQIFFTSNVGIIEERVEMKNGRALAYLRSNGRAGVATVIARSGGGVTAPEVEVNVGNTDDINIVLSANPATVTTPDFTTEVTATVFDNNNNPLPAVPLIFTTNAGSLASAGSTLRTNAQGKASDRLTLEDETSATVTVFSGSVSASLTIGRGTTVGPVVSSISPTTGERGATLSVTISGLNFQPGAVVSFGEGVSVNSVTFISSNLLIASITIDPNARITTTGRSVTVTNPDGGSGSLADAFIVTTPGVGAPPVIVSVTPASSGVRNPTPIPMTVTGQNFQPGAIAFFNPGGISVDLGSIVVSSGGTVMTFNIIVDQTVGAGSAFDLTIRNPDGGESQRQNAFTAL